MARRGVLTPERLSDFIQVLKEHRVKTATIEGVGTFDLDPMALVDPQLVEEYNRKVERIVQGGGDDKDLLYASADT